MHRHAQYDDVGRKNFVDQAVGECQHVALGRSASRLGRIGCLDPKLAQVGNRTVGQVALDDTAIAMGGNLLGGKLTGKLA